MTLTAPDGEELVTTRQLAQELGYQPATLTHWRMNNLGPKSFRIGRNVYYRRTEINRWFGHLEQATTKGGQPITYLDKHLTGETQ